MLLIENKQENVEIGKVPNMTLITSGKKQKLMYSRPTW